jgi:hypothetical protein
MTPPASQPILLLDKLSNIVFSQVLGQQRPESALPVKTRGGLETLDDLLNTTAHTTAYFLAFSACATPQMAQKMHSGINALIERQVYTLRKVAQELKEGKTRREIISDIRANI